MTMNRRPIALLLTVAALIADADVASAQPAASPEAPRRADEAKRGDDKEAQANVFFRQGTRLYRDGKYVEAEAALLSAWELRPTFDVAHNLGNTEYQLKKHKEAAQYLSYALRDWPQINATAKQKPKAQQRFDESRAQVGAVTVTVRVVGAEVLVDGKVVGKAPLEGEVFVDPGERRLEARLEGYMPASQMVQVARGGTAEVTLAMAPVKSEAAETPVAKAEGAVTAPGAPAGAPAAEKPPVAPVERPPGKNWVPAIALGAASAVGLGVGIATTVASNNANSDGRVQRDQIFADGGGCLASPSFAERCAKVERSAERAGLLGDIALGSYIASGALAAAAVTYALWPARRTEKSTAVLVLPEPRVDGFGFLIAGAW
ncbi:PEGA domain-containing protein [Sorangium sp. So ce693]|uniref:PEGA domain-containing protein n=1 Tax=Sorangium sp. So ce693 TaxID=3133318 RepID=UPI003F5E8223